MDGQLANLREDVRLAISPYVNREERSDMLDAIGVVLAGKRDEAVKARQASGIEQTWRQCEEAYLGIDDANRHEWATSRWAKPVAMDAPVETGRRGTPASQTPTATVFLRLTARYVDAGWAKLCEILLPPDDKPFSFTETPVPELIDSLDSDEPVFHDQLGAGPPVPLTRPARPGETPTGPPPAPAAIPSPGAGPTAGPVAAPPGAAIGGAVAEEPRVPLTEGDLAQEKVDEARKKAKKAEKRIHDWMVEGQHRAQMRKVLKDSARIGVGMLKGPVPDEKNARAIRKTDNGVEVVINKKLIPVTKWVDPWNCYPDPACGEVVRDGDYFWECDWLSEQKLLKLARMPGYIESQVRKVIKEGPDKKNVANDNGKPGSEGKEKHKNRFTIWYGYVTLTHEEFECVCIEAGKPIKDNDPVRGRDPVFAIVTLVNDTVIKATVNPLDSGNIPYHNLPWQRREGHWAGVGIAEQVTGPQRMLNAGVRAMLNNSGKAAGSQFIVDRTAIEPADGKWEAVPDKFWWVTADGEGRDVRTMFYAVDVPNITNELMVLIEFTLRMAEESTSIPLVTQGQSGKTTPDTYGAAALQNSNANQLLRSLGYSTDDHVTEPVVMDYYEYLLLDPDVPDDEKGDWHIDAHGSAALVERAIQDQTIAQLLPVSLNPQYKLDPELVAELYVKSKFISPNDVKFSKEKLKKIEAQPPPKAPQVEVAEIRAASEKEKLGIAQQQGQAELKLDAERAVSEAQDIANAHAREMEKLRIQYEIALMGYAKDQRISVDKAKTELAKTTMTLQTQRELSVADKAVDMHKHRNPQPKMPRQPSKPANGAEPAGRAAPGQAFSQ